MSIIIQWKHHEKRKIEIELSSNLIVRRDEIKTILKPSVTTNSITTGGSTTVNTSELENQLVKKP